MKNKFKDTKLGKILTGGFVKTIIKSLPGGEIISGIVSNNSTPEGKLDKENAPTDIIKLFIVVVLVYLVFKGHLSWDEAEQAKDFIGE